MFNSTFCINCGKCLEVCPNNAIDFDLLGRIDRNQCDVCQKCVDVCNASALSVEGVERSVQDILVELNKDRIHYRRSNGGITLSGGESLLQSDFAVELLKGCKAQGWHTAIETTGFCQPEVVEKILPWTDLFLYDLKMMDSKRHGQVIGQPNEQILENAELIAKKGRTMIVRIPIIPDFNDDEESIIEIAKFVLELGGGVERIDILPYHRLGEDKYYGLGREYRMKGIESPSDEKMESLKRLIEDVGIYCTIGGID